VFSRSDARPVSAIEAKATSLQPHCGTSNTEISCEGRAQCDHARTSSAASRCSTAPRARAAHGRFRRSRRHDRTPALPPCSARGPCVRGASDLPQLPCSGPFHASMLRGCRTAAPHERPVVNAVAQEIREPRRFREPEHPILDTATTEHPIAARRSVASSLCSLAGRSVEHRGSAARAAPPRLRGPRQLHPLVRQRLQDRPFLARSERRRLRRAGTRVALL